MEYLHTFGPVFDSNSRILILGSFPSVKSREEGFYYGHPQNRFWAVIASICGCEPPRTVDEKKSLLLENHIALWDVCASCEVDGSSDASIRSVVPNDIGRILAAADITGIYTNGRTAEKLYNRLILPNTRIEPEFLPSTSPANAAMNLARLTEKWKKILPLHEILAKTCS